MQLLKGILALYPFLFFKNEQDPRVPLLLCQKESTLLEISHQ